MLHARLSAISGHALCNLRPLYVVGRDSAESVPDFSHAKLSAEISVSLLQPWQRLTACNLCTLLPIRDSIPHTCIFPCLRTGMFTSL